MLPRCIGACARRDRWGKSGESASARCRGTFFIRTVNAAIWPFLADPSLAVSRAFHRSVGSMAIVFAARAKIYEGNKTNWRRRL